MEHAVAMQQDDDGSGHDEFSLLCAAADRLDANDIWALLDRYEFTSNQKHGACILLIQAYTKLHAQGLVTPEKTRSYLEGLKLLHTKP